MSRADVSIVDDYGEMQQGYSEASFGEVSQANVFTLIPMVRSSGLTTKRVVAK